MADLDLIVRSGRVVTPDGIRPADVCIRNGRISAVTDRDSARADQLLDAGDLIVMPGLVDTHVHINEPGRTDWEGFESATKAAAAGGVTTLVDMPLNSVPATTTAEGLAAKRQAASGRVWVDVGFWGGAIAGNAGDLAQLARSGVLGFKCFLVPSGVDEFPFLPVDELRAIMPQLAHIGLPVLVHAELPEVIESAALQHSTSRYDVYVRSRPAEAEHRAVELLIEMSRATGARVHIVHVSSPITARLLEAARHDGVPVSGETCPHYLTFSSDQVPDGATEFKCAPPIRDADDREQLWQALERGALDLVVTDHSPSPPALKHRDTGDFNRAWGGIASLQVSLPAVWTQAQARGIAIDRLAAWMCRAPAELAGLGHRKGRIAPGYDADLALWAPDETFVVDGSSLYHRHALTPYQGLRLSGVVHTTFLRGHAVFDRGRVGPDASGRLIAKDSSRDG